MSHRESEQTSARRPWLAFGRLAVGFAAACVYLEAMLQVLVFGSLDRKTVLPLLFSLCLSAGLTLAAALLPRLARRIFSVAALLLLTLLAEVQLVYHAIFGNLMPLNLIRMGGEAVGAFTSQTIAAIRQNLGSVLLLLVPMAALICSLLLRRRDGAELRRPQRLAAAGLLLLCAAASVGVLYATRKQPISAWSVVKNTSAPTDLSYRRLGMPLTTLLEARSMLFGGGESEALRSEQNGGGYYSPDAYNVTAGLNFRALAADADDEALAELDNYFASAVPTKKNRYTGMLKGCNVITICAESFSPWIISPELTPTLYKMTHHGFVFENYYGSFQSVTTNGEYTMCMGLFPDLSREKVKASFDLSIGHYLPFCLGNSLRELGYQTYAYHNYIGTFYNRVQTHPNMGYTFRASDSGLDLPFSWPASDREMIDATVDDYLESGTPFHAYYMTMSGHYKYDWENDMSARHRDAVEALPYSDTVKAFIACNLEVEDALTDLEQRLAEAGIADRTLIVLTNDHYPYGLSEAEYNELAGREIDTVFERYHNSFICYLPGVDVEVPAFCSTEDVLPTVLNLLGVEYDSRLLAGRDALADGEHIAILADGSFLTDGLRYNAATGEAETDDGSPVDAERLEHLKTTVRNRFRISTQILNTNYYAHAYGRQSGQPKPAEPVFRDVGDATMQNMIGRIVALGLIDPQSADVFGVSDPATLGEALDVLYRMAGSPEPGIACPAEYDGGEGFGPGHRWYPAVCWAFDRGVLRPDDPGLTGVDGPITSHELVRLAFRALTAFGKAPVLDETQQAAVRDAQARYPALDAELHEAIRYFFDTGVYLGNNAKIDNLFSADGETLTRGRLAMLAYKVYAAFLQQS